VTEHSAHGIDTHVATRSPRARIVRIARLAPLALLLLVLAWLGVSAVATWRLTRRERPPYSEVVPAALRERVQTVRLATRDGEHLGAWWLAAHDRPLAALLLHGNGGTRGETSGVMRWLADQRVAALAVSLRAHGDSSGSTNDAGWSASADVVAGVEFIEQHAPSARIVIIGRSAGAAAAVFAARELGTRVSGYVLEQPYRDLRSAVRHRLAMRLPFPLDDVAWAGMLAWSRAFLSVDVDALSPIDRIGDIPRDVPIVLLTGTNDRHAPADEVEAIASRAVGRAEIVRFEGASHVPLHEVDGARYEMELGRLLAQIESQVRAR
jgi:pimeloyl-ACP methyl ester carboxylesterase